jgi:hypothetical protein
MKHVTHQQTANPLDVFGMMGMQVPPFDLAEKTCRAWMAGAQAMQGEASAFLNARAGKDMAAMSEFAQCRTPTEALEMQARYASEAMSDYVAGGQRMFGLLTAAGQRGVDAIK